MTYQNWLHHLTTLAASVAQFQRDTTQMLEELEFATLASFLYTDFYRGLAAGHIPRRCHNCGRYLLLTSGFDIRYCTDVAPGETVRICRQVGAHNKETERNGTEFIRREYLSTRTNGAESFLWMSGTN